ncbi:MAG: amidohydrolase family protein [Candidatus Melainabacteria bacterium]
MRYDVTADRILADGVAREHWYFRVENGVITRSGPLSAREPDSPQTPELKRFDDALVIPGLVNSHTHSFQSLLKGFCDDRDFFTWRDQALYRYAAILTEEDIYTGALFAFAEMLKTGVTTVCDFFYIHDQANANANAVIRAARDLGMRITMARTMYDWQRAPARFQETVAQAVTHTRALHAQWRPDPMVHVIPAPHSLHGASLPMIEAGAALAEELDTVFHMHVAEGQYEREMMLREHGHTPIALLEARQVLNPRLTAIHCVWLDDEDIERMASGGAMLSYNPSSNMFLGDGVTRIAAMLKAGITIALGTDGGCSNNRASVVEEMRMTSLLQKVTHCDGTVITAADVLSMATVNGGRALGLPLGVLAAGHAADFTVVSLQDLSMQPRQNALNNLVYSSQPSAVQAVYVAGGPVFCNGRFTRLDEDVIIRRVQQTTGRWSAPV